MFTRHCELEGCGIEFQTDHPTKKHCCTRHSTLNRVRRCKAKKRKGGGPGGGGNNGGGAPTLFDELIPVDPQTIFVEPSTCYQTPKLPERKPSEPVRDVERHARRRRAA